MYFFVDKGRALVSQSKNMDEQTAHDSSQSESTRETPPPSKPLTYEETPLIDPVPEEPPQEIPTPPELPAPSRHSIGGTVAMTLLFLILFAVGMGISVVLRQYLGSRSEETPAIAPIKRLPTVSPMPTVISILTPTASPTATLAPLPDAWKTYSVVSGTTKQSIAGVTFQLPPEISAPVCDGGNCASQGTYLPGSSRFTVAPRGRGQLLIDARGAVGLTDAAGKSFTTKQITLEGGKKAIEYTGNFQGSTVGGYTFSAMHGFMIEIDDGLTVEMNHFAPSGLTVDFAADETVFAKIVATVGKSTLNTVTLTPTPTP